MKKYNIHSLNDNELKIAKSILFTIMNIIPCTDTSIYLSRPPHCSKCVHKDFCDTLSAIYTSILIEKIVRNIKE